MKSLVRDQKTERRLFDVIATTIATGAERVMERDLTEEDAGAFIRIAVIRRGVDEEFYSMRQQPETRS